MVAIDPKTWPKGLVFQGKRIGDGPEAVFSSRCSLNEREEDEMEVDKWEEDFPHTD